MPSKASSWARKIRTSPNPASIVEQAKSDADRTAEAPLLSTDTISPGTNILQFFDHSIILLENDIPTVSAHRPTLNAARNILDGKSVPLTNEQRALSDSLKAWRSHLSNFLFTTSKEIENGPSEQREAEIADMLQSFAKNLAPFTGHPVH